MAGRQAGRQAGFTTCLMALKLPSSAVLWRSGENEASRHVAFFFFCVTLAKVALTQPNHVLKEEKNKLPRLRLLLIAALFICFPILFWEGKQCPVAARINGWAGEHFKTPQEAGRAEQADEHAGGFRRPTRATTTCIL